MRSPTFVCVVRCLWYLVGGVVGVVVFVRCRVIAIMFVGRFCFWGFSVLFWLVFLCWIFVVVLFA